MKKVFLILIGLLPMLAWAVTASGVYPNSGTTDARRDQNMDIGLQPSPPVPQEQQEENLSGPKKKDDFVQGPYDKKGNYRYVPEVKEEK